MKFTIAAGILTQVLPATISENSPSTKLFANGVANGHDHDDRIALSRALKSVLPQGTGETTIGFQNSQSLDGVLKNDPFSNMMNKACDPSSNDPEIGILSCNPGFECLFDQASTLGGFCISISRDLQEPDPCYICGDGYVMGIAKFDLPVVIGYTSFTCGNLAYSAYANVTLDSSLCGPAGDNVKDAGCCVPSYDCDLCGSEGELLEDAIYDSGLITMKCGHVAEILNDAECPTYFPDIAISCCNPNASPGSVVPTPAPVADPVPSAAPDTPTPPTSASNGRLSTTILVSMMTVTVVTAAGSLFLN